MKRKLIARIRVLSQSFWGDQNCTKMMLGCLVMKGQEVRQAVVCTRDRRQARTPQRKLAPHFS